MKVAIAVLYVIDVRDDELADPQQATFDRFGASLPEVPDAQIEFMSGALAFKHDDDGYADDWDIYVMHEGEQLENVPYAVDGYEPPTTTT